MTKHKKSILLTGATGFLGSHFLRWFAPQYRAVHCLVRADSLSAAEARLRESFSKAARSYNEVSQLPENVQTIVGGLEDVASGRLADSLKHAELDEVWHFASSLNYEERKTAELFAINVEQLRGLLSALATLPVARFIYVSTAYTCGTARGYIPEQLHPQDSVFNNQYERSKAAAEWVVHQHCATSGLAYTILRPSIVVGPSATKKPGGSTTGLYGFIRELARLKKMIVAAGQNVRIDSEDGIHANFVPVDHVMEDIAYVIDSGHRDGPIYHLTSTSTFQLKNGFDLLCSKLGIDNLMMSSIPAGDESPVEQLLSRRNVFYRSYMRGAKTFVRSIPLEHGITLSALVGFLDEAIRDVTGKSADQLLDAERVTTPDGSSLQLYRSRQAPGPALVLVNAYGMPVEFFSELIHELARDFTIYTWESRGVPSPSHPSQSVSVDAHVADLAFLMDHFGLRDAHVAGWCTGARIALEYACAAPSRVRSLSLLHGAFDPARPDWETDYNRNLRELSRDVASNPKYADLFFRLFFASRKSVAQGRVQQDAISAILSSVDPSLMHLGSLPFRDPRSLACYARAIDAFCAQPLPELRDVAAPALVVSAEGDVITSLRSSQWLASELPNCQSEVLISDGDHFSIVHHASAVAAAIAEHTRRAHALGAVPRALNNAQGMADV